MDSAKVSTQTVITSIGTDINIAKLANYMLSLDKPLIGQIGNSPTHKKQMKVFKNQVQLYLPFKNEAHSNTRDVKIKVFNNGRLHITGTQSMDMVSEVLHKVNTFLYKSGIIEELFNEEMANHNIEIVMINMTIDAGFKIKQKALRDLLIHKYNIHAEFNPKIYAGINARLELNGIKQASFLIFQSGKINIAGAKGMFQLMTAKDRIQEILEKERIRVMMI